MLMVYITREAGNLIAANRFSVIYVGQISEHGTDSEEMREEKRSE